VTWSFVGGTSFGAVSTSSATPALPSGWAAGDLALITATVFGAATFTTPTGYTALDTGTSNANESAAIFYRVLQAGDTARTLTWSVGARNAGMLAVFRGGDATSPIEAHNVKSITSGTTAGTVTSLTPNSPTDLAVVFWASIESQTGAQDVTTTPTDYTRPTVNGSNPVIAGAQTVRQAVVALDYKVLSSTAAESPTVTLANSAEQRNFFLILTDGTPSGGSSFADTVALAGSGDLAGAGTPNLADAAPLAGSGALTGSGAPNVGGSRALTGTGTLALSGSTGAQGFAGSVALSGTGTLTGTATKATTSGAVALGAVGTLGRDGFSPLVQGASGLPFTVRVQLDDGTGTFPYDITRYVDLSAGYTIRRGRSDQFETIEASTLDMVLDNSDGRFTYGSAVYGVDIDQQIRVTHTTGGVASVRFTGYVQRWPVSWPASGMDKISYASISAVDAWARLSRWEYRSLIEEEVRLDNPAAYYPLDDPPGSTRLTNTAAGSAASSPMVVKGNGPAILFASTPGPGFEDSPIAPQFFGNGSSGQYLRADFSPSITGPTMWVSGFFKASTATSDQLLIVVGDMLPTRTYLMVTLTTTGAISATTNDLVETVTATSGTGYMDGAWHHVAVTVSNINMSIRLFLDGSLAASTPIPTFFAAFTASNMRLGYTNAGGFALAHVGVSTQATGLSATRIANHASAGLDGFKATASDSHISRYASYAGVTSTSLERGSLATMPPAQVFGVTAAQVMQDAATAEGGLVFVRGDGVLVMQARHHRSAEATPRMTISGRSIDPSTEFLYDADQLENYVTGARFDGPTQVSQDTASIAVHGKYVADLGALQVTTDQEVQDATDWRVSSYAQPFVRLPGLRLDLLTQTTAVQQAAQALEVSDRIALTSLPSQAPTPGDQAVEGWTETVRLADAESEWSMEMNTSAWSVERAWILADATYGVLGTSTRLSY